MRKLGKKLNQVERSVEAYTSCGCGCYCNEEPNYSYGTYMSQYTYTLAYYNR
ncbi:CLI_3235 family bacteriocin precursor [Clostridium sp. BNL1100]|uniref:CLI_3235 family bacteriocin precursor n=1 Tax=Clostridium sp. BNL1100 TaxID=755731 RepID=UPI0002FDA009|nr:CLI_3235 family bacteriocin precursor [Clostridium sp. BNL1100]